MDERTCVVCDEPYERSSGRGTCSTRCLMWAVKHPGDKPPKAKACLMCGLQFDVVHRAMRYCTPLCRAAASKRRLGRTSKPYVRNLNCRHCGAGLTGKAGQVYCSDRCQENEYNSPESRSLRVGRRCEHCGTAIPDSARVNKRHCSDRCTIIANQATRRARRKELPAERISRIDVLERDGMDVPPVPPANRPATGRPSPHECQPGPRRSPVMAGHSRPRLV